MNPTNSVQYGRSVNAGLNVAEKLNKSAVILIKLHQTAAPL